MVRLCGASVEPEPSEPAIAGSRGSEPVLKLFQTGSEPTLLYDNTGPQNKLLLFHPLQLMQKGHYTEKIQFFVLSSLRRTLA